MIDFFKVYIVMALLSLIPVYLYDTYLPFLMVWCIAIGYGYNELEQQINKYKKVRS